MQPISIRTFEVDIWKRLERFLILGCERGAYCISEPELTIETASAARACLQADGLRVVKTLVDISISERAPKNTPALFVLAMATSSRYANAKTNAAALNALSQVARTGAHLAVFAEFAHHLRGWGRGLRTAVADWYIEKPVRELATQMLQDRRPAGWSHRDLLRLAHPRSASAVQNSLFRWAVDGELGSLEDDELSQVHAFARARKATSEAQIVSLIEDHRLTLEMIPTRWKDSARVWEALLEGMPYPALLQNLGKLTALGVIAPQSEACSLLVARLADRHRIRSAQMHPIVLLNTLLAYQQGRASRGKMEWVPVPDVIKALDAAFYLAFENVQPSGTRVYLAIDASESCQSAACHGMPLVTAAIAGAVMAMSFARTERRVALNAFHERILPIKISKLDRLERACQAIAHEPGDADASLPLKDALRRGLKIDAFVVVTDSRTWLGEQHPGRALEEYRQATGIPAKLAVLAMSAKRYSLVDPEDARQLEVAGFDASVPAVLRDFLASVV